MELDSGAADCAANSINVQVNPALRCESGVYGISVDEEGPDAERGCHWSRLDLWDAPSNTLLWNARFPSRAHYRVAFNPTSSLLVYCSTWDIDDLGTVYGWNLAAGRQLYARNTGSIDSIALNPVGTHLLMVGGWQDGHTGEIWDALTGSVLRQIRWEQHLIANFSLCDDNIISLNSDGELAVWTADGSEKLRSCAGPKYPQRVRHHGEGTAKLLIGVQRTICAAACDGQVGVWDYLLTECIFGENIRAVDFTLGPQDETLAVATQLHIDIWDIGSQTQISHIYRNPGENFSRVVFRMDGAGLYFFDCNKLRLTQVGIGDDADDVVSRSEPYACQLHWLITAYDTIVLM
jgi:WD40 repeat protein